MVNEKAFISLSQTWVTKRTSELRTFCFTNFSQIIEDLADEIPKHDILLISNLFKGLTNIEHKAKVVDEILKVLRTYTKLGSSSEPDLKFANHCRELTSRVCLELPRLTPRNIIRWCNESLNSIENDDDVNMVWSYIFPECLNVVASLSSIEIDGKWFSRDVYVAECLQKLLECQWRQRQLVPLTTMLKTMMQDSRENKDLQLTSQKIKPFVIKICSYIEHMQPDTLPPLVYRLLNLCDHSNLPFVLSHLSHYFSVHYPPYKTQDSELQDSEATTVDDVIEQYDAQAISACVLTCVLYVTKDAGEPEAARRCVHKWPAVQLLREPFILNLALAFAANGVDFEATCLHVIKEAIKQSKLDKQKKKESAWVAQEIPQDVDVGKILLTFVTGSVDEYTTLRLFTGLAGAGQALVEAGGAAAGGALLARLARRCEPMRPRVLARLRDRLDLDSPHRRRYAECLRIMCKNAVTQMGQCAELRTILERVRPAGDHRAAAAVYHAVHPLLDHSASVRDNLFMLCRKGLYHRDSVNRSLALCGMLTILKYMRIKSAAFSQDSEEVWSQTSYLSQLPLEVHATQQGTGTSSRTTNLNICRDIVSVLRRCLNQEADVKELLYSRWYYCVKDKPSLHMSILEILDEHLSGYLSDADADDVSLLLDVCVEIRAEKAVLREPIGHLLYLIAQFMVTPEETDLAYILSQSTDSELTECKRKLKNILDKLSTRDFIVQIDMTNLSATDSSVEAKANCMKAEQILHVYEALIAHQILQWTPENGNADAVLRLFKSYTELSDNFKAHPKSGKKARKINDTQMSTSSKKSQTLNSKKIEVAKKSTKTTNDRKGPLPCLWDFELCYRIMELLYSEAAWCSVQARVRVRTAAVARAGSRRVHSALAARSPPRAPPAPPAPALEPYTSDIAKLLYRIAIRRFQLTCDFDEVSALECIEVFHECLKLLYSSDYNFKPQNFFPKITGSSSAEAVEEVLEALQEALAGAQRTHAQALASTACTLLREAPPSPSPRRARVVTKFEEYVKTSQEDCLPLLAQLLATEASHSREAPLLDALLTRLVNLDTEEEPEFPWVKEGNARSVWASVCAHVCARRAAARHLLERARSLATALAHAPPAARKQLANEQQSAVEAVVLQLRLVAQWAAAGAGAGRERVRDALSLYQLLAKLVKLKPAATLLLKLLEKAGDPLTSAMCKLYSQVDNGKIVSEKKQLPNLLRAADQFYKCVLSLDPKDELKYKQYLKMRITPTNFDNFEETEHEVNQMDVDHVDESADESDKASDADTEVLNYNQAMEF